MKTIGYILYLTYLTESTTFTNLILYFFSPKYVS